MITTLVRAAPPMKFNTGRARAKPGQGGEDLQGQEQAAQQPGQAQGRDIQALQALPEQDAGNDLGPGALF